MIKVNEAEIIEEDSTYLGI